VRHKTFLEININHIIKNVYTVIIYLQKDIRIGTLKEVLAPYYKAYY